VAKFRFEGPRLTVDSVDRSVDFYVNKLALTLAYNAVPDFAMVRSGDGGTSSGTERVFGNARL
jgi:catechol 2,3-dioxygenase-like lactoylglutathione lyase family enzyme